MNIEAKVGFFVALVISMLFLLTTQVSEFKNINKDGYRIQVFVDDSTGLERNSKVKMNGINIGWLESFEFSDDFVILNLFIKNQYKIPIDSQVKLVQESLLGTKLILISRGKSKEFLQNGSFLKKYKKYASFEETSDSIYRTSEEFKKLAKELRETLNDDTKKNFQEAIENLSIVLEEIKEMIRENRSGVKNTISNIEHATTNIDSASNHLPDIIKSLEATLERYKSVGGTLDEKLPGLLDSINSLVYELNSTVKENRKPLNKSLKSIDGFFTKGQESIKKLNKIISSLSDSELQFSMRVENNFNDETYTGYIDIAYLPNPSTYYLFSLISAPDFSESPNGNTLHDEGQTLFSLQYGKRYKNWLFRAGLIESTGGVGLDYFANKDKLKLSIETFDFNAVNDIRNDNANLKLTLRYRIYNHIDLFFGGTNLINKDAGVFLGIGFYFIDNDLKILGGVL